jgi:hypothetical protein
VQAGDGSTITIPVPARSSARNVYPIVNRGQGDAGSTAWFAAGGGAGGAGGAGRTSLGSTPNGGAGAQGIAPTPTVLHPLTLDAPAPAGTTNVVAEIHGTAQVDALLLQPLVSHLGLAGARSTMDVYVSASAAVQTQTVGNGHAMAVSRYDDRGQLLGTGVVPAHGSVPVAPGGFTVVTTLGR